MQDELIRALKRTRGTLDVLIVVPAGAVVPSYLPPKVCKVWGIRGQCVAGPGAGGGGAQLALVGDDGIMSNLIATMDFDTTASTPTPKGVVDAALNEITPGMEILVGKTDPAQAGWVIVTLGFDLTQVGPVVPMGPE
ncbi:MAG: hypothetical protein ABIJ57_01855 [Pseudomonadota bacterium]